MPTKYSADFCLSGVEFVAVAHEKTEGLTGATMSP